MAKDLAERRLTADGRWAPPNLLPAGSVRGVPARCQRAPNATFDRQFAIFTCDQRDPGCPFYGAAYVLDADGRHHECRKREGNGRVDPSV
jgi:hypothetical protein